MDVLQASVAIVGRREAKLGFHGRAPSLRQVLRAELALEQFQLEVEAQDNMQIVGHLVGVSTNGGAHHFVDGGMSTAIGTLPSCSGKTRCSDG